MEIPKQLLTNEINFVLLEKGGKKPFEIGWQKKKINYNSIEFCEHIKKGGNYGVMGGGDKKLIIIDFDNEELQKKLLTKLPKTFTVKTGSGLLHKYFFSDGCKSFKIFDKEMDTLADIQGEGKQVVGAGSIHPNGNKYEVVDDCDINFLSYGEIKALLMQYDKKPKKEVIFKKPEGNIQDDFIDLIKTKVGIKDILTSFGVNTSINPTECPFHNSKGGKCLGFNNETAHCFHCDGSWNLFSLIMEKEKLNFKDTLDWIAKKYNLEDELKKSINDWKKSQNKSAQIFTRRGQAEEFLNNNPIFFDNSGMFWRWNFETSCYELTDETNILNSIAEKLNVDTINSKEKTEILNSLKQEGRKKIPLDIKPTWIQFKNKIVDILTGKIMEATPEYFVTNPIPYELHKENFEATPVMDKIFEEWVGKDYVKTLYEIIAYCLIPDYPIHRLFCFIGGGLNGKSKFLELLRKFIGKNNCCSTELDTLMMSRFEVTRLHKKLICQMGETDFEEMSKTSILKKLTGGDLIGFEYKNKNPFEEINYAKILISTNNLPTTTDKTIGFYRRWLIIDFPNQFSEKKDILADIPEEEYKCLALKSIAILHDLLVKREFHKEGTIENRMERYENKSDFLKKFMSEFIEENPNGYITTADFRKKFSSWCDANKHRKMDDGTIGKKMKEKGIEKGRKFFDWLNNGKGGQLYCFLGLKWKD